MQQVAETIARNGGEVGSQRYDLSDPPSTEALVTAAAMPLADWTGWPMSQRPFSLTSLEWTNR